MPRIQRNRSSAVIEVSIPLSLARRGEDSDDDDEACVICAQDFCAQDACVHCMTYLKCCSQAICCGCAVTVSKKCTCEDECEAVIAICPFCREMAPLKALHALTQMTRFAK